MLLIFKDDYRKYTDKPGQNEKQNMRIEKRNKKIRSLNCLHSSLTLKKNTLSSTESSASKEVRRLILLQQLKHRSTHKMNGFQIRILFSKAHNCVIWRQVVMNILLLSERKSYFSHYSTKFNSPMKMIHKVKHPEKTYLLTFKIKQQKK